MNGRRVSCWVGISAVACLLAACKSGTNDPGPAQPSPESQESALASVVKTIQPSSGPVSGNRTSGPIDPAKLVAIWDETQIEKTDRTAPDARIALKQVLTKIAAQAHVPNVALTHGADGIRLVVPATGRSGLGEAGSCDTCWPVGCESGRQECSDWAGYDPGCAHCCSLSFIKEGTGFSAASLQDIVQPGTTVYLMNDSLIREPICQ